VIDNSFLLFLRELCVFRFMNLFFVFVIDRVCIEI
jgi:hypothetical protein